MGVDVQVVDRGMVVRRVRGGDLTFSDGSAGDQPVWRGRYAVGLCGFVQDAGVEPAPAFRRFLAGLEKYDRANHAAAVAMRDIFCRRIPAKSGDRGVMFSYYGGHAGARSPLFMLSRPQQRGRGVVVPASLVSVAIRGDGTVSRGGVTGCFDRRELGRLVDAVNMAWRCVDDAAAAWAELEGEFGVLSGSRAKGKGEGGQSGK